MADQLDLKELAQYLHLDLTAVRRMAERGKIPGRRVDKGWRFDEAEIHRWLEKRILNGDLAERTRLEGAIERHHRQMETGEVSLEELLPPEAIAVPLAARTKNAVVDAMVDLAAGTGLLWDPEKMAEAVKQREELFPTAVGGGAALLHPRRPMESILGAPLVAFGRTGRGIPFGDPEGGLTDLFFLILSVDDRGHLRILARLSRALSTTGVLEGLRKAEDAEEVRRFLLETEAGLSD